VIEILGKTFFNFVRKLMIELIRPDK